MSRITEKRNKKGKPRLSFFRYYILNIMFSLLSIIVFHKKIIKKDKKLIKERGASIVLCNHTSNVDITLMNTCMLPQKMVPVISEKLQYEAKATRYFCKGSGAITKKQFTADVSAIRHIMECLKENMHILIFPEGKISTDGTNSYMSPSIVKLIKMLKVPVNICRIEGGYHTRPRWSYTFRKSKPRAILEPLYSKEDILTLSNDEIYNGIMDKLAVNDNFHLISNKIKIKSKKRGEGLEKILYKCPNCSAEFKMKTKGCIITCENCNNKGEYTVYGQIQPLENSKMPARIDLWYNYIKESATKDLLSTGYEFSDEVIVFSIFTSYTFEEQKMLPKAVENGKRMNIANDMFYTENENCDFVKNKKYDKGILSVDINGLYYNGTLDGKQVSLNMPSEFNPSYNYITAEKIEYFDKDRIICFYTPYATKFNVLTELAFMLKQQNDDNIK